MVIFFIAAAAVFWGGGGGDSTEVDNYWDYVYFYGKIGRFV